MVRLAVSALVLLLAVSANAAEITRDSVIAAMNSCRAERGLPALQTDARLQVAAEDRMRDMEELEYWAHVSPDGRSPFNWLRLRGYLFRYAGENLAAGFETAELLVSSWMESKGHRENILSPIYQDCGIAIIDGSTTGRRTGRSIVVLFGRPD
jgi:uncharacterized protein YkwD